MLPDPQGVRETEQDKRQGRYRCPDQFYRNEWCDQASRLFSQEDWRLNAVDPVFDVVVENPAEKMLVFKSVGVEIIGAEYNVISGGEPQTGKIEISGTYAVGMPEPTSVRSEHGQIVHLRDELRERSPDLAKTEITAQVASSLAGDPNYEWIGLPITVISDIEDPVRIAAGDAYRFNIVLQNYPSASE